ncbi:MAG: SCO family protein [Steroidobacteraceae bacterium]
MTPDTSQLRARNLRTLAGLAALFFVPLLASAWLYYGTSWRPGGHVNHGELIQPPRPLPPVDLPRVALGGELAAPDPTLFRSKWTLVYIGDGSCDASCRATLYVMRQTRLALGTEMTRLARVFLVTANCCANDYLAREHAGITVLDASGAASVRLLGRFPGDRAHSLFIVDPLGNLMMRYDVRRDPRGLLVDLRRLLQLSQIG